MPEAVLTGMAAAADNVGQLLPARLDRDRVERLRQKMQFDVGQLSRKKI